MSILYVFQSTDNGRDVFFLHFGNSRNSVPATKYDDNSFCDLIRDLQYFSGEYSIELDVPPRLEENGYHPLSPWKKQEISEALYQSRQRQIA